MSSLSHGHFEQGTHCEPAAPSPQRQRRYRDSGTQTTHSEAGAKESQRSAARTADRIARLTQTIEADIIPRLLLANSATSRTSAADRVSARSSGSTISSDDVGNLAVAVVRDGLLGANRIIEQLEAQGTPREAIFLDLLAPAARQLGTAWEEDSLTFVEVTIGLARLQQLLRKLSAPFENHDESPQPGQRALLMPAPGEQHSFGLFMVEAFFRRAGWDVTSATSLPLSEVARMVRRQHFDVIGISKSCSTLLDALASDITTLRRASCNKDVTVLVGGPAFDGHPERVTLVGADATANNGQQAVWQASRCTRSVATR